MSRTTPQTGVRYPGRDVAGFTLIELMVAMLLGLVVIAGVGSVFIANLRSYHTNTALGDVQSNARIAFELMARDVRQAGDTGCNSRSNRVSNVLTNGPVNGGADWWANWANAVRGYDGNADDPAVAFGAGNGGRVANTASLQLMSVRSPALTIASDSEPTGKMTLNVGQDFTVLEQGDLAIICDPDHAVLVQLTTYNSGTGVLVHGLGGTPGNFSRGLGYPTGATSTGLPYVYPSNTLVAKLGADDWYIGHNPAGGDSLYRVALVNNGGAVSTQAQEMVRGVTGMSIGYHLAGASTIFLAHAASVANWNAVDAVRVNLTLESADKRAGVDATGVKPLTRSFSSVITIRNRVD